MTSGFNAVWAAISFRAESSHGIAADHRPLARTSGTAGRWAPIIKVGMSSRDPAGYRLPPITPIDDAVADPTADGTIMTTIIIDMCLVSAGAVLSPDAQSRRSSHGINGVFSGSVKATFGSHQFTQGVDQGFL